MPPKPLRRALAALPPIAAVMALAGCSGGGDRFPPACPVVAFVPDGADFTRYRGTGRDITDVVLEGHMVGVSGKCEMAGPGKLQTSLSVSMTVARGPAAAGRAADVAYFVAVMDGDRVLQKQTFPARVQFPPNADQARITDSDITVTLPVTSQRSGSAYTVFVGFQLTPQDLALNRSRRLSRIPR